MATPTKYFHDRSVLLLLALNSVILITGILFVLFHLDASKGSTYIIQCRLCDTASHEFKSGTAFDISGFIIFMLIAAGLALSISRRVYTERRQIALAVLGLTGLLSVFALIVSYSLFSLR